MLFLTIEYATKFCILEDYAVPFGLKSFDLKETGLAHPRNVVRPTGRVVVLNLHAPTTDTGTDTTGGGNNALTIFLSEKIKKDHRDGATDDIDRNVDRRACPAGVKALVGFVQNRDDDHEQPRIQ